MENNILSRISATGAVVESSGTADKHKLVLLGADGKLASSTLPAGLATTSDLSLKISTSEKGAASGVATLGADAKIPTDQLPDSILGQVSYAGTWNASTNTPAVGLASLAKGKYYIVSTAGTFSTIDFNLGDWIISNGTDWQKVDTSDAVTSFNGRVGAIAPQSGDYDKTMVGLGNVDNTSDADKPVSSATATALSGKADTWHTHTYGISDITGLTDALAGKAASTHYHSISDVSSLQDALNAKANALDVATALGSKVDTVAGKGLSTNDYTTTEKDKLAGLTNGEPPLGNPSVNGYVLSSTTSGTRSWVAQSGGGGGGAAQKDLTVLAGSGATPGKLLGYSNGSATPTFSNIAGADCNPLILIGGAGLTSLTFANFVASNSPLRIVDFSGLTGLTELILQQAGGDNIHNTFVLPDTSAISTTLSHLEIHDGNTSFNSWDMDLLFAALLSNGPNDGYIYITAWPGYGYTYEFCNKWTSLKDTKGWTGSIYICDYHDVPGCMDPTYCAYDPAATYDDGSCAASGYFGCIANNGSCNYNSGASCDDGSCYGSTYCGNAFGICVADPVYGCLEPTATNYNPGASCDDGSCAYGTPGCMDPLYCAYDSAAAYDDGSCYASGYPGCTEPTATNYNPSAGCDDGSCEYGLRVYDNTMQLVANARTPAMLVADLPNDTCHPISFAVAAGCPVQSLAFANCSRHSDFVIDDTSALGSLTVLVFDYCGNGFPMATNSFILSDCSGLTALTSLAINDCGYDGLQVLNTTGMSSLTSLTLTNITGIYGDLDIDFTGWTSLTDITIQNSFRYTQLFIDSTWDAPSLQRLTISESGQGNYGGLVVTDSTGFPALEEITITASAGHDDTGLQDMSGMTSLMSLIISGCSDYNGHASFVLPTSTAAVGTVTNLAYVEIGANNGSISANKLVPLTTQLVAAGRTDGTFIFSSTGTSIAAEPSAAKDTLRANLAALEALGWVMDVPLGCTNPAGSLYSATALISDGVCD